LYLIISFAIKYVNLIIFIIDRLTPFTELRNKKNYTKTAAEKSTAVRKTAIFFILGDEIPSPVYKVKKR